MAFLMFISTSGMTMDIHMCSGQLKRVNLFGPAKTCLEKIEMQEACHKKSGSSSIMESNCANHNGDHKGCCQNDSFELDIDSDLLIMQVSIADMLFLKAFLSTFMASIPHPASLLQTSFLKHLKPPLISSPFRVLYQVFRL